MFQNPCMIRLKITHSFCDFVILCARNKGHPVILRVDRSSSQVFRSIHFNIHVILILYLLYTGAYRETQKEANIEKSTFFL